MLMKNIEFVPFFLSQNDKFLMTLKKMKMDCYLTIYGIIQYNCLKENNEYLGHFCPFFIVLRFFALFLGKTLNFCFFVGKKIPNKTQD